MSRVLLDFGLPFFAIYCIAKYYNNIKIFLNDIYYIVASVFGWGKRISIRGDIQLVANKSINDLNKIAPELQMPNLEIEWVKELLSKGYSSKEIAVSLNRSETSVSIKIKRLKKKEKLIF